MVLELFLNIKITEDALKWMLFDRKKGVGSMKDKNRLV